jgi:uncharacterized protein (DUF1778 family)
MRKIEIIMPRALKKDRFDLRLTPETKETIEKAALISGQSLTDFVVAASTERAREVIRESEVITLSARDYARVLAALDSPPEPSPALRRAAERYGKMFE